MSCFTDFRLTSICVEGTKLVHKGITKVMLNNSVS